LYKKNYNIFKSVQYTWTIFFAIISDIFLLPKYKLYATPLKFESLRK